MNIYINKKEYEALHGAWDHLSQMVENGAEDESLQILGDNILGLVSLIDKYKSK